MATDLSFGQVLAILKGNGSLRPGLLALLSDLSRDDLSDFRGAWSEIGDARRLEVARRLVQWKGQNTLVDYDPLFVHMLSDTSASVRLAAIDGLEEPTTAAHVPAVLNLMETDTDERVRAASARVLASYVFLSFCGLMPRPVADTILPRLLRQLDSEATPAIVRQHALVGAAYAADEHVHVLIESAYEVGDVADQVSAITAMGVSGDRRWVSVVSDEMESPYREIRLIAARAAGNLGDPSVLDQLLRLVEQDEVEIQLAAVEAIGKIGGSTAQGMLEDLLYDADLAELEEAIEEALEELAWSDGLSGMALMDFDPSDDEPDAPFTDN